jgi:hypothetical protein
MTIKLRRKTMRLTDVRVTQAHEIITGIRTVKLNAWEESWLGKCQVTRTKELSALVSTMMIQAVNFLILTR